MGKKRNLKWREQSKLLESLLVARPHENNRQLKLQERSHRPHPPSKSHIDSDLELLLSEKSENIRSRLSFSSENFHSNDWSAKSHKTSRPTFDSSRLLSWLSKKPVKPIW